MDLVLVPPDPLFVLIVGVMIVTVVVGVWMLRRD
jgi:hypothetical protein